MQIENLHEQQELDKLNSLIDALKEKNSEIKATTVTMSELDVLKRLDALEAKLDFILNKMELIFGGHHLIDGRFVKIPF